ncbi:E3 ubiquitin-protein ligase RHF2A [Capsicum chinense]|nr:E3 ubiquitin-protein ligase RHF2A [Capsicum chinense]
MLMDRPKEVTGDLFFILHSYLSLIQSKDTSQSRPRGAISSSGHVNSLPMDIDDAELEECILQHLVVATSMGRAHHMGQRDGSRNSSSTNEHASSARKEADARIAGLSHLMECLKTQENSRAGSVPAELL